ncbi:MAG TPA: M48 family metallopeptidase [Bryobacteraceae bacterium]|nr:M48 family metallopeptidase [Bryobacteraceae bacterium]
MNRKTGHGRARAMTKAEFKAEVAAWAKSMRVKPVELHIRPMSRKWGSCSTRGRVTFNSELLSVTVELRREAIVEELLHLKVPNHGKLFKALKRAYLAGTRKAG